MFNSEPAMEFLEFCMNIYIPNSYPILIFSQQYPLIYKIPKRPFSTIAHLRRSSITCQRRPLPPIVHEGTGCESRRRPFALTLPSTLLNLLPAAIVRGRRRREDHRRPRPSAEATSSTERPGGAGGGPHPPSFLAIWLRAVGPAGQRAMAKQRDDGNPRAPLPSWTAGDGDGWKAGGKG